MPQIDISGSDSKLSCDKLQGQSGTTVAIQAGHSISGDGSGLTSLTAGNLVGSLPAISGASLTGVGGAWNLIGTQTASSSTSLTQTGLNSTYDMYVVTFTDIVPATNGVNPLLRVGNSGGIISTTNTYSYHVGRQWDNSGAPYQGAQARNTANTIIIGYVTGNASGSGFTGTLHITGNQGGTTKPFVFWQTMYLDDNTHLGYSNGAGNHDNAITMDRFQFYFSSGNISTGVMRTYGIANS
jgi:hypothetical protein